MTDYSGKRITVMGLGRFGGGIGVTRWLVAQGADVLVTDQEPADELADSVAKIQDLISSGSVTLRLGEHNVSDFTTCDLVVANAAVLQPWDNRFLRAAEAASIPITTEIVLMLENLPAHLRARTVAVTGSAGKSTTVSMIHHALDTVGQAHGRRAFLGGNIGGSLLGRAGEIGERDWLVLELSSAQVYWIHRVLGKSGGAWPPRIGVVMNIAQNHTDWHGSFEHYGASKRALIEALEPDGVALLGESVWDWKDRTRARAVRIEQERFELPLAVPGAHNRVNAAAALAAVRALAPELDAGEVRHAIAAFSGLTHRLQLVIETKLPEREGEPVKFYNDSKSTTPESALKAIEAVADAPGCSRSRIHLIAGGYDKGSDLTPIAQAAQELAGIYTIGATGPKIAAAAGGEEGHAYECETLAAAFDRALGRMRPGDVLLLSPGCASWGVYKNFEERGEEFMDLVRKAVGT